MKTFILLAFLLASDALAAYKPFAFDPKFPNNKVFEYQLIENPLAASTGYLKIGQTSTSTASTTVSFSGTIDLPRNVVITPTDLTTDIEACDITITGKNILGATISEAFAFTANQSSATTGAKAFKSITSAVIPAACQSGIAGARWNFGIGEKLGVTRCLDNAGDILFSLKDGSKEATLPTVVADVDEVEKNTADVNGTMDGSADWKFYYIQNYRCQP